MNKKCEMESLLFNPIGGFSWDVIEIYWRNFERANCTPVWPYN